MIHHNRRYCLSYFIVALHFTGFFLASPALSLEPHQILVLANRNAARSIGLAEYYMKKRGIPKENIVRLWVTDKETCSRSEYEKKVAAPVRKYLDEKDSRGEIRCLVTMYGLPLKISPSELTSNDKKMIKELKQKKNLLESQLQNIPEKDEKKHKDTQKALNNINKTISNFKKSTDKGASLDSEIALLKAEDYPINGWVQNPYFLGFRFKKLQIVKAEVLMVSRLDGPSDAMVKRIIDDSIKAEKNGLSGTAYFDARWPDTDQAKKNATGYAFYDQSIYRAAYRIKKMGVMPVKIEGTMDLFQPGDCPDAALYCGWYSLSRYIDAFVWQPGAVGYHIASGECTTLKKKNSRVWCKMMLEKGISATVGPVAEPYVQAFPVPEFFFGFLVDGVLSLAECYFVSVPYLSWKMVLVGDPLYRPFQNRNAAKIKESGPG